MFLIAHTTDFYVFRVADLRHLKKYIYLQNNYYDYVFVLVANLTTHL